MTLNSAAKEWLAAKAVIAEAEGRLNAAKAVLLDHFHASGESSFKGVGYAKSTLRALDVGLARAMLGPKKAEACTVDRTRETLSVVR